jgi:hypothetical protein
MVTTSYAELMGWTVIYSATYQSQAGSKAKIWTTGRIDIKFDWYEEGLCLECEPDADATREANGECLVVTCDACGIHRIPLVRVIPT